MPAKSFYLGKKYNVIKRESLAIVWAIDNFKTYLFSHPFVLQTDHKALTYFDSATHTHDRVMRWTMLLQAYNIVF